MQTDPMHQTLEFHRALKPESVPPAPTTAGQVLGRERLPTHPDRRRAHLESRIRAERLLLEAALHQRQAWLGGAHQWDEAGLLAELHHNVKRIAWHKGRVAALEAMLGQDAASLF